MLSLCPEGKQSILMPIVKPYKDFSTLSRTRGVGFCRLRFFYSQQRTAQTRRELEHLNWEIIGHAPCSPDLTSSDINFFQD